ncbi:hypothetical protein CARUB_v10012740mg [Capsella rubella]|uniref:Uncharacterized protein n=1 Tax=Capsella rubella TaxID=81985 RepID=R0ESI5_9BRAS|nr:hypothetical protein CARUB_v10012740mg [Capsella rubella]
MPLLLSAWEHTWWEFVLLSEWELTWWELVLLSEWEFIWWDGPTCKGIGAATGIEETNSLTVNLSSLWCRCDALGS